MNIQVCIEKRKLPLHGVRLSANWYPSRLGLRNHVNDRCNCLQLNILTGALCMSSHPENGKGNSSLSSQIRLIEDYPVKQCLVALNDYLSIKSLFAQGPS